MIVIADERHAGPPKPEETQDDAFARKAGGSGWDVRSDRQRRKKAPAASFLVRAGDGKSEGFKTAGRRSCRISGFHGPVRAKLFRARHRVKPVNPEPRLRGPLFFVLRTRGRNPAIRVPRWIGVVRSFVSAQRPWLMIARRLGRGLTPHQVLCFRKQTRVAIDAEARGSSATLRDPPLRVRKKTLLPEPPAGHEAVSPDRRPARHRTRSRQSARPVRRANRIARRRI